MLQQKMHEPRDSLVNKRMCVAVGVVGECSGGGEKKSMVEISI